MLLHYGPLHELNQTYPKNLGPPLAQSEADLVEQKQTSLQKRLFVEKDFLLLTFNKGSTKFENLFLGSQLAVENASRGAAAKGSAVQGTKNIDITNLRQMNKITIDRDCEDFIKM